MEYNIKIGDLLNNNKYIQFYFIKETKELLIMLNCFKLEDILTFNLYDDLKIIIVMKNNYIIEKNIEEREKILFKKAENIFVSIPDKNFSSINIKELPEGIKNV